MPYHYDNGNQYAYHKYNNGQWYDYSGGLIITDWYTDGNDRNEGKTTILTLWHT